MSFPNKVLKQTYLSEQDKADLLFGIENGVDFVAASFVSCKQDVLDLKEFLHDQRRREDRHHRQDRKPRGRRQHRRDLRGL